MQTAAYILRKKNMLRLARSLLYSAVMRFFFSLAAAVTLTSFALVGCAAEEGDGTLSGSSEEGEDEIMSDEGLDSSADALTGSLEAGTTVYTTARVNFRTGPSTNDSVMRVVPNGTAMKLVDGRPAANGFYKVQNGGDTGYMHGAYLTTGAEDETDPDVSNTGRRVSTTALYLGSCEFLGRCASSATRRAWAENRTIYFGCDGRDTCSNGEAYLSVPRNGPACGSIVRICRVADRNNCVNAKVRERSDSRQRYELSPAAAMNIGLDPHDRYFNPAGGESACSGSMGGDARITISY